MTLPPPPLERLRERLLAVESSTECMSDSVTTCWYRNPDGPEAADYITALLARIGELEAENARLRNINNEDGLVDPELAAQAGTPMSLVEAAARTLAQRGEAE